ncbi:CooT family nickel-binding protein [Chloroflexota bacterium]
MCLAKVYLKDGDEEKLVMETVAYAEQKDGKLLLKNILRQEKEVEGEIVSIDFSASKIVVKPV